jgi:hypothetical protein
MAEIKSVEQLQAELDAFKAKNEALAQENQSIRAAMKNESSVGKVIAGEVALSLKKTDGTAEKATVGFAAGHIKVKVIDFERGWNENVSSEALLAHANGKMSDAQSVENPLLATMTSEQAKSYVEELYKAKYKYLVKKA